MRLPTWLIALPDGLRGGVAGAVVLGASGGLVGLVIGLFVYAPTAWFALLEIGLPGAVVGFAAGGAVAGVHRIQARMRASRSPSK